MTTANRACANKKAALEAAVFIPMR